MINLVETSVRAQHNLPYQSLRAEINSLSSLLVNEINLPMGMRSFLAEECSELDTMLTDASFEMAAIAWKIHAIALTLGWCREIPRDSELSLKVKLLDLKLQSYRRAEQGEFYTERDAV